MGQTSASCFAKNRSRCLLQVIGQFIYGILFAIRWFLVALLAIGLPVYIYLAFIAHEPVFSVEKDVYLGQQAVRSIAEDPEQYPLLSEEDFPEVYAHLRGLVDRLLGSPEIQYLDYQDHLAGVLGHEIAHAELRHSSQRLQKDHGAQRLLDFVLLSNPVTVGNVVNASILKELMSLNYSRDQEAQADGYSVRYLATSGYACDGTAGFFTKLLTEGQDVKIPEFLSDHPGSEARVQAVRQAAREAGCRTELGDPSEWKAIQASLPPQVIEAESIATP